MVKVPTTDISCPEALERRTQLLHDYGAFMALWSEFEFILEVKIAALAGMEPLKASIVLGGLSFGNKPKILYSLLSLSSDTTTAPKVRAVINAARRNALVHSVVASEPDLTEIGFVTREVGNTYKVRENRFTADSFHKHFLEFRRLYYEATDALGITVEAAEQYGRTARLFAPDGQRPPDHPPRAATD